MNELISEIERYLAAVDVFRAEGCEPRWSPEDEEDLCRFVNKRTIATKVTA